MNRRLGTLYTLLSVVIGLLIFAPSADSRSATRALAASALGAPMNPSANAVPVDPTFSLDIHGTVAISNTAANPVPVAPQGTTQISGNVQITNAALPVNGTVNVGNLPASQAINGTVSVGNFPATQPVNGTVNVGNLPVDGSGNVKTAPQGTQNVSIVGGNITAGTTPANSLETLADTCPPHGNCQYLPGGSNATLYVSTALVESGDNIRVVLSGPQGGEIDLFPHQGFVSVPFTQPVPTNHITVYCPNSVSNCSYTISLAGNY